MKCCGSLSVEERYRNEPIIEIGDYEIIRSLARYNGRCLPNNDFLYFICKQENNGYVEASTVIGDPNATFDLVLPQAALYNTLRVMIEENAAVNQTESFSSHAKPWAMHTDKTCDTFDKWRKHLATLNEREQQFLKKLLIEAHLLHCIEPTENETTMQYLQRHAQRYGNEKSGRDKLPKLMSRKKKIESKRESEKWDTKQSPVNKQVLDHDEFMKQWDDNMEEVELDEDADIEMIFDSMTLFKDVLLNTKEKESVTLVEQSKRIAKPRQLGAWITLKIDGESKSVSCNCERCNRTGKCAWVASMEVIQFSKVPDCNCLTVDESYGWDHTVTRAREAMIALNIHPPTPC